MTDWGCVILAAAIFLGLRRSPDTRAKYAAAFVIVVLAVGFAAVRQHTY
jgi:hypothetical protein